jgi:hypothetical protein
MGIQYCDEIKILGFHMRKTTKESSMRCWEVLTARIRATAKEAYLRDLSMDYRIRYVHDYLLARAWYTTEIYPPMAPIVRQLNMIISWFIWQGVIFRVPLSTLQKPKEEGGWELIQPEAKCKSLFQYRMREQGSREGAVTADWLKRRGLHVPKKTPPTTREHQRPWGISIHMIWKWHT